MIWLRHSLVCLLLFSSVTASAGEKNLLAVLPLDVRDAQIDVGTQHALEESIRTVSGDTLSEYGWVVLTGETTLAVLQDNGLDPSKACEASCALAAARELKAKIFIAGTVTKSEGSYIAFVRLFENNTGSQLGSASLEGATIREVRKAFEGKANSFFARVLKEQDPSPPVLRPTPAPVVQPTPAPTPTPVVQPTPPPEVKPAVVSLPPAAVTPPPGPPPKPISGAKVAGIVTTVVGALALAGGATFAVITRNQTTDLRTHARPVDQAQTLLESTNRNALTANVLLVAGGVCAAGGVALTVAF